MLLRSHLCGSQGRPHLPVPRPLATVTRISPINVGCLHVAQAARLCAGQQEQVGLGWGGIIGAWEHIARVLEGCSALSVSSGAPTPAHRDNVVFVQTDQVSHAQVLPFLPPEAGGWQA